MSEKKRYANTTDSSVVIDEEGHMIDGGATCDSEWNDQIEQGLNSKVLVEVEIPLDETPKGKTVEELQEELRKRELPVSGNKAELVARLEEDDQRPTEDDDDAVEQNSTNKSER